MGFVLVPVPTDHVLEVMRWVLFRSVEDDDARQADRARVVQLVADSDADTRRLLHLVAASTVGDDPIRFRDLADELGQDPAVLQAKVAELNDVLEGDRELLEVRSELSVGVHGQTGTIAYIAMRPDLVSVVKAATRPDVDAGG